MRRQPTGFPGTATRDIWALVLKDRLNSWVPNDEERWGDGTEGRSVYEKTYQFSQRRNTGGK